MRLAQPWTFGLLTALDALVAATPRAALAQVEASAPATTGTDASRPAQATTPDPRIDAMIARQTALEDRLAAQQRLIDTLRRTVALPTPGASATPGLPFLAVPTRATDAIDPELTAPLAGYSDRNFFLRDRHSWFVLVPKGRLNVDWYNFLNPPPLAPGVMYNGAADARNPLRNSVFVRRARLGLAGTVARHIDFRVEGEFASLPTAGQYATVTDASAVVNYTPLAQLEVGQFYAPFTLENPTSENFTDFMEKSSVVRFAVGTGREIGAMVQGTLPRYVARYWVGVFEGDGQNVRNLDTLPAAIGRAVFAPLALLPGHETWLQETWIGGSFWYQPTANVGGAATPSTSAATAGDLANVTTQSGWSVFSSNYNNGVDGMGRAIRSHLAPDGTTIKYALELNVPLFQRFGIRGEYVHQSIDLRQYNDVNAVNGNVTRTAGAAGNLTGWGTYVEAYAWLGGAVNVDRPGLYQVPHWNGYVPPQRPQWAVMLAAKYEHVAFDVSGLANGVAARDPAVGHYALDTFEAGASFWVTRHARLMANYALNYVGAGGFADAASLARRNLCFQGFEHELSFRFAVSL
jgi:hypothetical protein